MIYGMLPALRALVTMCIVGYAAYSDIKSREVDDTVWLSLIVASAAFVFLELVNLERGLLILFFISVYVAFAVGLALTAFRLTGGADLLALVCLSLVTPPSGAALSSAGLSAVPSLSIFVNALLVSCLHPIALFARNLALLRKGVDLFEGVKIDSAGKLLALFTLTRIPAREFLHKKHAYALAEEVVEGGKKLVFRARIGEASQPQGEWVWVSPYTPFVAMLAVGYAIHLFYGCILDPLITP